MREYDRKDFYSKMDNKTGKRNFYIKVNEKWISVDRTVYNVFYNAYRKELRYIRTTINNNVISYDRILDNGLTLLDMIGAENDYLEQLYQKDILIKTKSIIDELGNQDREIIIDILFNNIKEKELANKYNIRQQNINKRKKKIIKRINQVLITEGVK